MAYKRRCLNGYRDFQSAKAAIRFVPFDMKSIDRLHTWQQ